MVVLAFCNPQIGNELKNQSKLLGVARIARKQTPSTRILEEVNLEGR